MRVLHVIPSLSAKHGGPSQAVRLYAEAATRTGVTVVIAATTYNDSESAANEARDGFSIIRLPFTAGAYTFSIPLVRWLRRHVGEFDLLHIHALFSFPSTVAAWFAGRKRVPYIIRPLGVLNRWGMENRRALAKRISLQLIERRIVSRAMLMHYTTEAERSEAIETLPELEGAGSVILPVPVPDEAFEGANPELFLQTYPQIKGKEIVLFLSRIDRKKGLDMLLPAFRDLLRERPAAHLVIAGSGDETFVEEQRQVAADLQITNAVTWAGWLEGEMKRSALAACSLFVLPSYSENFGVAVAEALAAGRPVLVSEGVALAADLRSARAGYVCGISRESLAAGLLELLALPDLRAEIASAGTRFARERLSIEVIGRELNKTYHSVTTSE